MLVDVALEVVKDLFLENSRAGIPENADGNLTGVVVPTLYIYQDFDVAGFSVARNDTGNLEIGGRFAGSFRSDLRDRTDGKTIFNHDWDPYMRSSRKDHPHAKEFT
jgi:hypothetical protein